MITKPSTYNIQEISMIPLGQIKPLYMPHITQVFYRRMSSIFSYLSIFDLLLPVEKHPQKNEYVLVGRYDLYYFIINHTSLNEAPCIIEEFTEKNSQSFKILRRLHNKGDSNKISRQNILNKCSTEKLQLSQITKMTGFTKQDLKDYHYNSAVPKKYVNNHTTEATLNWITSLYLNNIIKEFLYERAGLPQKHHHRLTGERCKFLRSFFKEVKGFERLSIPKQIQILTHAINCKGIIINFLQKQIDSYLD